MCPWSRCPWPTALDRTSAPLTWLPPSPSSARSVQPSPGCPRVRGAADSRRFRARLQRIPIMTETSVTTFSADASRRGVAGSRDDSAEGLDDACLAARSNLLALRGGVGPQLRTGRSSSALQCPMLRAGASFDAFDARLAPAPGSRSATTHSPQGYQIGTADQIWFPQL